MGFFKFIAFNRLCIALLFFAELVSSVGGIGVNWGTQATHPLPPATVVRMLQENGIQKVKFFDANSSFLSALSKSGIQVMVGISNDMLSSLASSVEAAENWVAKNLSSHISSNGVDIRPVMKLRCSWFKVKTFKPEARVISP